MKTITAEMLVAKAKENGKEFTMEQAEKMISERASLSDDQLTAISGGNFVDDIPDCPNSWDNRHQWEKTGVARSGSIFGDLWPEVELRCQKCGKKDWVGFSTYD